MTALCAGTGPNTASQLMISATPRANSGSSLLSPHVEHDRGVEEVAGIEFVRGRLAGAEVRRRGPVRARLLAGHQGLQVVAVPLDRGGRVDLDRRVAGEDRTAGREHVAEEDNFGEAERAGYGHAVFSHAIRSHDARSGLSAWLWAGT